MDEALNEVLRKLVTGRSIAALGTVDKGEPFVSMVPFVLHGAGPDFLIHVSGLAAHTRQMLAHPQVSLMITAAENAPDENGAAIEPQALPRVTAQGAAMRLDPESAAYAMAKAAYLARFPQSALMFELADFSLIAISPRTLRFVAGFGKAHSLRPQAWSRVLAADRAE